MLRFVGDKYRHCDGVTRRQFLTAGALTMGGLSLADLLRAEASAGVGSSNKAIINVHLDGGPPQMDMIDLKPQAPAELRGEFNPISTSIPGVQICELLPRIAAMADRFAFIRSLVGPREDTTRFNVNRDSRSKIWSRSVGDRRWVVLSRSCLVRRATRLPHLSTSCKEGRSYVIVAGQVFLDQPTRLFDQTSRACSNDRSKMA